jgi:curli biogenesis system outer membrane secretion channel CsgG
MPETLHSRLIVCLALCGAVGGAAHAGNQSGAPQINDSKSTQALQALPPKPLSKRIPVTIYEFRSGVEEITAGGATDMFTTALVKSGQFRVVERSRLNQGVVYEKQLNGAGQATGNAAQKQLRGARYIFEGTVSEANVSQDSHQGGINIGGLSIGRGKNKDAIAIDVRIVDANTGDVLDAVDVNKPIDGSSAGVSGTAALASSIASMTGHTANPLTPDVNYQSSHKDGIDAALRACIEAAVLALIQRVELTEDSDASN